MLNQNDLAHFTGTEGYTRTIARNYVITDGVLHVAVNGGGRWGSLAH